MFCVVIVKAGIINCKLILYTSQFEALALDIPVNTIKKGQEIKLLRTI